MMVIVAWVVAVEDSSVNSTRYGYTKKERTICVHYADIVRPGDFSSSIRNVWHIEACLSDVLSPQAIGVGHLLHLSPKPLHSALSSISTRASVFVSFPGPAVASVRECDQIAMDILLLLPQIFLQIPDCLKFTPCMADIDREVASQNFTRHLPII